jgi:hypothetical protein
LQPEGHFEGLPVLFEPGEAVRIGCGQEATQELAVPTCYSGQLA